MANYYLLTNLNDGKTDAIIVSEESSAEDIAYAIGVTKAKRDDWQWEDVVEEFPKDCKIVSSFDEIKRVYY